MSGTAGVDYVMTFAARNRNGTPRVGLGAGAFTVTVRNPADTASDSPTVTEIGGGMYRFTLPAAFTTAHGSGEYGATVELTNAPRDIIAGTIEMRAQGFDNFGDSYQAKVWLIDDDLAGVDRYKVAWYLNGEPLTSGITVPTLRVFQADAPGTSLVSTVAMTQAGSEGVYFHDESSSRIGDGAGYFAVASAIIGGGARSWIQPVGRDS